ncbi:CxxH/CxxC protein [Alteribacter lacisalsi]|uniref:CxxH/CxxC protein n=2 Tax=Alteribacter lacisalsi TaxID=2045244 RepID=A0A2W0H326_9BACI|nr:CxxH/CxxC protein [Alteribacter lacisalsi]
MYYCCKEHIDMAIEDIVDYYALPPIIDKLTEEEQLSTTCKYCSDKALYRVDK